MVILMQTIDKFATESEVWILRWNTQLEEVQCIGMSKIDGVLVEIYFSIEIVVFRLKLNFLI